MPATKVLILGTGGNCIDILDTLNDINERRGETVYLCAGFLDDDEQRWQREFAGVRVLGPLSSAGRYPDCLIVNGIGSPNTFRVKREIIAKTGLPLERFATIVHPSASISRTSRLGAGTVIFQNVTITSNVVVGNHVVVLPNSVLSHDTTVGDYSSVAGGVSVSGGVSVGESCYLGASCVIRNNVRIEDYSLIGMGSVVLHDVRAHSVVVGNPARVLRSGDATARR